MRGSFGSGSPGSGGAGTIGMCGKCSLRETVQPVGVGINVICKVSFTPTGGVAVLPEDWCSGASISKRQSCRSAKVGVRMSGILKLLEERNWSCYESTCISLILNP